MTNPARLLLSLLSFFLLTTPLWSLPPTNVTVLTKAEIENRGFVTLADVFTYLDGVDVRREGNHGAPGYARGRGLPEEYVVLAIDGTPMNGLYGDGVDLSQFPIAFAERIEITKGSAPTRYSAQAGAAFINLITVRPEEDGLSTTADTNVGRDGQKNTNGALNGRSYYGDLTYAGTLGEYGGYQTNELGELDSHYGKITRSFKTTGFWSASYFFEESETGLSNGTQVPFRLWDRRAEQIATTSGRYKREDSQRVEARAASPDFWTGRLIARLTRLNRDEEVFPDRQSTAITDVEKDEIQIEVRFDSPLFDMGYQRKDNKRNAYQTNEIKKHETGGFLTLQFEGDHGFIKPGVRYDALSSQEDYWSPRVSAGLLVGSLLFSGNAAQGFRPPTDQELYVDPRQNAALKPEETDLFDVGLRIGGSDERSLSVTGFFTRVQEAIQSVNGTFQNQGEREVSGVEGALTFRMGKETKWFNAKLEGHWTHQKSRVRAQGPFETAALMPQNVGRGALTHYLAPRMEITNEVVFYDKRYGETGRQGTLIPSATIWNARWTVRVLKAVLYLEGRNLLQNRYALSEVSYIPNGGGGIQTALVPAQERAFYTGIRIRFKN